MTSYQVLARKYRPKQFAEVVGQSHVVQALSNALTQQSIHHAYLLTGTHGVGKTTLARIFARCLNCETGVTANPCGHCCHCQEIDSGIFPDFYEIDAASRTKVEDTRDLLNDVQYAPVKGRYKVYLIDEVHMLSGHSFNALLKTLEEPPEHVKFLLATTEQKKLPATVLSRCLQFHLQPTSSEQACQQMSLILEKENIPFEAEAVTLIASAARGSMRDALSLLDQCIAYGNGKVLTQSTRQMLGTIEPVKLFAILQALHDHDGEALLNTIRELSQQGVDFKQALADLISLLHQISVCQVVTQANSDATLQSLAKTIAAEDIQLFYQIAILGQRDFDQAPSPEVAFEMTLLRMLAFYPSQNQQVAKTPQASAPVAKKPTADIKAEAEPQFVQPWEAILPALGLDGAALALAQNCSLLSIEQDTVYFAVMPNQRPMLLKSAIQRINKALSDYFQRPVTANIEVKTQIDATPMQINKQNTRQMVTKDRKIQGLMERFDATLVEDSMKD